MICGCAPLKWVNRWQDLSCAVWPVAVGGKRQRSEKAKQWSVECRVWSLYAEKEEDWSEDLGTESTKKRR